MYMYIFHKHAVRDKAYGFEGTPSMLSNNLMPSLQSWYLVKLNGYNQAKVMIPSFGNATYRTPYFLNRYLLNRMLPHAKALLQTTKVLHIYM